MSDETPELKVKKHRTAWYINATNNNIFTEQGKCAPGGKLFMSPQKARLFKGLLLCKK